LVSSYTSVASAKMSRPPPEANLQDMLTKIVEGQTINRMDELARWWVIQAAATAPSCGT
jgi:hypothetical protein